MQLLILGLHFWSAPASTHTVICLCNCQRGSWIPPVKPLEHLLHREWLLGSFWPTVGVWLAKAYFWALCLWKDKIIEHLPVFGGCYLLIFCCFDKDLWLEATQRRKSLFCFMVPEEEEKTARRLGLRWWKQEVERSRLQHQTWSRETELKVKWGYKLTKLTSSDKLHPARI